MKHALKEVQKYAEDDSRIKEYNDKHPHENEGLDPIAMLRRARFLAYLRNKKRISKGN